MPNTGPEGRTAPRHARIPKQQEHNIPGLGGGVVTAAAQHAKHGTDPGASLNFRAPGSRGRQKTPTHGRRAQLAGSDARAAVSGSGTYDPSVFPKEYHKIPNANAPARGSPDLKVAIDRAKQDTKIPAVGQMLQDAERQLSEQQRYMDQLAISAAQQHVRRLICPLFRHAFSRGA